MEPVSGVSEAGRRLCLIKCVWSCGGFRGFNSIAQDELLQCSCFVEAVVEHERLYSGVHVYTMWVLLCTINIYIWVINSYHIYVHIYEYIFEWKLLSITGKPS